MFEAIYQSYRESVLKSRPEHQAKIYGYWLLGKRFNSYSPTLAKGIGPPEGKVSEESEWEFLGVYYEHEVADILEKQQDQEDEMNS